MKVLLIDPPGWQKHSINLGLAYLAGAALKADIDVQILDMNNHSYSEDRLRKIVADYNPQVIGISVKTATANSSAGIFRNFKNYFPDIIYISGGPHITLCGNEFMNENKEIDFGIAGEGESSFVNLLKSVTDGKYYNYGINGIYYRKNGGLIFINNNGGLDVSKLALPRFEYIKDMDFNDFRYPLLTSRGCSYGCIFCCVGLISGKKWRGREPEDVVNELMQAKERYRMSLFEIMDDNFTFDIDRAKKICKLIIKKKLNLDWWCHNGLRADRLDRELLNLMKKAGCKSIALGIETGDKEVFKNINKGEELSDIINAVRMTKKAGIKCVGYFIVGLPGDSIDSTKNTVRLQRSLKLSDYKYNMLIPYPGTRVWDIVKEKGRLLTDIRGIYHFGDNIKVPFETNDMNKKTIEQCMYLSENQEWVAGEKSIISIKKHFNSRFGRDIKRAVFMGNDLKIAAKNIEIEFNNANILEIRHAYIPSEIKNRHLLDHNCEGSYFDTLFRLIREEAYQVIFDISKRRLLIQRVKNAENEYVRGEVLSHPLEWDSSARKYFATRLKNNSSDTRSAKNGIVYKDNTALPFSADPQWEKTPCGKIESGLAFISTAAFNPDSVYTADYLAVRAESELK